MKNVKLFLAVLLFCFSQFAQAVATPDEQAALDSAIAAVQADPTNLALVEAAIQAAANADVAAGDIITQLQTAGATDAIIASAMEHNIALGVNANGSQPSCAPNCSADQTGNVSYNSNLDSVRLALNTIGGGATGAGGGVGGGLGGLGGAGTGGLTGGPNGAITPH